MKVADIARSTYYYQLKSMQRPDKYSEIKRQIESIYHLHKERYGYRRIYLEIKKQGHTD